jgi:hypothetical protein
LKRKRSPNSSFEMEFASFPIWHFLENKSPSERTEGRGPKRIPKMGRTV